MTSSSRHWPWLKRFFPFLTWFPISPLILRSDLLAGITGALVLVPKAMAYAQLSGLPVHFGLYVAFVPAILGALWGSSRQLATGPVAIVSLMTAAALTPLAAPFSEDYIGLALLLTLMVGVIQFALGALKLGTIVNFVSHPVILGFMNAAAIIIGLSQLDMLLGIPKGRSDSFLQDIWDMLGYLPQTHWPTLAMSAFALILMLGLKHIRLIAKLSVLIAVVVTIIVSQALSFERGASSPLERVANEATRERLQRYVQDEQRIKELNLQATGQTAQLRKLETSDPRAAARVRHELHVTQLDAADLAEDNTRRMKDFKRMTFLRTDPAAGETTLHLSGQLPAGTATDGQQWRIKKIEQGELRLTGGGEVVGNIPQGLPAVRMPTLTLDGVLSLLSAAIIIALVGFMESIAMAKAIAATTKQRIDPNQELIGQGVANLGGAFFQSYPACGSFTGSAINLQAGAQTGFAMVFNGLFVVVTLLFLTPYLYHLPKATLGVIILLAVTSLVTPAALKHTWRANRGDGIVALLTFVVTLVAAPHLDRGILFGAALAILLYLYRTMKPRVAQLGRHADGALHDVLVYQQRLNTSTNVIALRFDSSLYFANAPFFEDAVLDAVAHKPQVKYLLIVASGINQMDASGEEVVRHLVERMRENNVTLVFCGIKKQVMDVMRRTGLYDIIGAELIFPDENHALEAIYRWLGPAGKGELLMVPTLPSPETSTTHSQTA